MSTSIRRVFVVLVVFFGLSAPSYAQSKLEGKVVDEEGKGVRDAIVMLRHADGTAMPPLKTNRRGEFKAEGLRHGQWRLEVLAPTFAVRKLVVQVPEAGSPAPVGVSLVKDKGAAQLKELQGLLNKGDELFKAGKFAEARAEYEKILEARPDVKAIHRSIAFTYGREGNHQEALKHLDVMLQEEPGNIEYLQLATASALGIDDVNRAMGYVAKIDDGALTDPDVLTNVAIDLLNKRKSAEATRVLDRVVARFPDVADPYFYRALAKLQAQNVPDAKADLEKFVSMAPPESKQAQQAKEMLGKIK